MIFGASARFFNDPKSFIYSAVDFVLTLTRKILESVLNGFNGLVAWFSNGLINYPMEVSCAAYLFLDYVFFYRSRLPVALL